MAKAKTSSFLSRVANKLPNALGSDYTRKYASGILAIDSLLKGGLASGRVFEVYGGESTGKTTIALHVSKTVSDSGGTVIYFDYEKVLDSTHAKNSIGLDITDNPNFIWFQPSCIEDGKEIIKELKEDLSSGKISVPLMVFDSVPSMIPRHMLDEDDDSLAPEARAFTKFLKPLCVLASDFDIAIIFINQTRSNIGASKYAPKTKATGARALRFYASVRLELNEYAPIKVKRSGKDVELQKVKVTVKKDKVHGNKYKTGMMYFDQEEHRIDKEFTLYEEAKKFGVIQLAGSHVKFEGETIGQGSNGFIKYIEDPENYNKIYKLLMEQTQSVDTANRDVEYVSPDNINFSDFTAEEIEEIGD